jgi:hypothetical protein
VRFAWGWPPYLASRIAGIIGFSAQPLSFLSLAVISWYHQPSYWTCETRRLARSTRRLTLLTEPPGAWSSSLLDPFCVVCFEANCWSSPLESGCWGEGSPWQGALCAGCYQKPCCGDAQFAGRGQAGSWQWGTKGGIFLWCVCVRPCAKRRTRNGIAFSTGLLDSLAPRCAGQGGSRPSSPPFLEA